MKSVVGALCSRPWVIVSAVLVIAIAYFGPTYGPPLVEQAMDRYEEFMTAKAEVEKAGVNIPFQNR